MKHAASPAISAALAMMVLFGPIAAPATADDARGSTPVEGWKPWILASGSQIRPGPPPAVGSAQFQADLAELQQFVAIPTPPFPSYASGHATFSAAASEVLAFFFPQDTEWLRSLAEEAALSRVYAGIHYRFDSEAGLQSGRQLGLLAIRGDAS